MLAEVNIEVYLPIIKRLKQWSDRKKMVEEPLFRSYLFVHINHKQYLSVLSSAGVVRFITFEGKPVPIPTVQIEAIKKFLEEDSITQQALEEKIFTLGQNVTINRGSLQGLTGKLVQFKGRKRVLVEIESIGHSVLITVPRNKLDTIV